MPFTKDIAPHHIPQPDNSLFMHITPKAEQDMENNFDNQREAFVLLDLINAEFQSDPMSTQCFDLRIVQRVRECVAKRAEFVKNNPVFL
jgi:hypothetical protein